VLLSKCNSNAPKVTCTKSDSSSWCLNSFRQGHLLKTAKIVVREGFFNEVPSLPAASCQLSLPAQMLKLTEWLQVSLKRHLQPLDLHLPPIHSLTHTHTHCTANNLRKPPVAALCPNPINLNCSQHTHTHTRTPTASISTPTRTHPHPRPIESAAAKPDGHLSG